LFFTPPHTTKMAEEQDQGLASAQQGGFNYTEMDLEDCKELENPNPIQASLCRKGVFVLMSGNPCKVAELKISKTGKHGSSKAAMYGYDLITNRKYQETVPGHATLMEYVPKKFEYEVVDISGGEITAITPEGEEKKFPFPAEQEHGQKLLAAFNENAEKGGDDAYLITVLYCQREVGNKMKANIYVESFKPAPKEA
jgi:translation elongation factor P/translation initiation factor 5A